MSSSEYLMQRMTQLGLPKSVKLARLARRVLVCAILFLLSRKAREATTAAREAPAIPAPAAAQGPEPVIGGAVPKVETSASGFACGAPFSHVGSALMIESPDSKSTTVIYLVSNSVACVDLSFAGWDSAVTQGTTVLEFKVPGKTPGTFRVGEAPVNARVAAVECSRKAAAGHTDEARATGGLVSIETLSPASATGRFTVDFPGSHLTGTFDATLCPGGHEP